MNDDHPALTMPDVSLCYDIVRAFEMCGRAALSAGGMSLTPVSFTELSAMNEGCGLGLDEWAMRQVRFMSENYCNTYSVASKGYMEPPYLEDEEEYGEYITRATHDRMMEARKIRIAAQNIKPT